MKTDARAMEQAMHKYNVAKIIAWRNYDAAYRRDGGRTDANWAAWDTAHEAALRDYELAVSR